MALQSIGGMTTPTPAAPKPVCKKRMITSIEQLFAHLGANWNPNEPDRGERLDMTQRSLSRSVERNTVCGAWAMFEVPTSRVVRHEEQRWTGRYARIDGAWEMLCPLHDGVPAELSAMPTEVREYFWPPSDDGLQAHLSLLAGGASTLDVTESVRVGIREEHAGAFVVGSTVEGIDAEVSPITVYLPCEEAEIDAAIADVEAEAARLWDETHGCDHCGPESRSGYRTINPKCHHCHGAGTII